MITNPILRGFNADPSICRVGDDYYIATSTFEWFPGVQIHHSRDLKHWRLLTRPLDSVRLLDMRGVPHSGGIWAPCLSWSDGQFWLIYTNVKQFGRGVLDAHNYLTTAPSITGPWSDPVFLNSSGFDPSLFHDADGRKWLVNMRWDHRINRNPFNGIMLQEYSVKERRLVGEAKHIFSGTKLGFTEGPHLYRRDGWYYLMMAEGGTGWDHAVSMARSRAINGPYEIDPENPVVTSVGGESLPLQKAGHASIVDTQKGQTYLVHLCGRPLMPQKRCILGRETAIQACVWRDGWLRLAHGGRHPAAEIPDSGLPEQSWPQPREREDFNDAAVPQAFQSLRVPIDDSWLSLTARPGHLRLLGRESLASLFEQSLLARRVDNVNCVAETCVDFAPSHFQQMAGLVCYYDLNWYYLHLSHDEQLGRVLRVSWSDDGKLGEVPGAPVAVPSGPIHLRATFVGVTLGFAYSTDGKKWTPIGGDLDATRLSDDYGSTWHFTGCFVGMCAQDLAGTRLPADFDYFTYRLSGV